MPVFSVFYASTPDTKTKVRPDIVEHITEAESWIAAAKELAAAHNYGTLQYRACCEHITSEQTLWNGATLSRYEADAYNGIWRTIKRWQAEGLTAPANLYDEAHRLIADARKTAA